MRRVAITGIGLVTPVGTGRRCFWENLVAGRSGIDRLTLFDVSSFPVQIGGEVKDFNAEIVHRTFPASRGERDRKVVLGLAALDQAMQDAQLACLRGRSQIHVGVSLESFCLGDLTAVAGESDMGLALLARESRNGQPLQTPLNRLAQVAADRYQAAEAFTNCSACAAGAQAIGQAFDAIRYGEADLAVAGGADSMLNPLGLGGFSLLRILSAENDRPDSACRPFDLTRQGTVLGEGAGFLVLEDMDRARHRGATIHAELLGYGSSMDAFRLSDPDPSGQGAILAMEMAIHDAGLSANAIDCVNAHATGTPKNDIVETAAIKAVLGPRARQIPVHSVKSMTGHLIAASGAVEAAAAVLTILNRQVPPTINLHKPDPQCDLDYCPNTSRAFDGDTVLANSFGFGGQNATLIFRRYVA